jgi:large subunit ribosomal protein L19
MFYFYITELDYKPYKTMSDKEIKTEEKSEEKEVAKAAIPELKSGMTVRIYQKIKELNIKGEEKERIQYFEGRIIAIKHGSEIGGTITVRKISNGVGVEKIFPLNLPTIERIEIKKEAKVRRSKLYFLKRGFKKKLKETVVKQ